MRNGKPVNQSGSNFADCGVLPKLPPGVRQYVAPLSADADRSDAEIRFAPFLLGHALIGYRDEKNHIRTNHPYMLHTPVRDEVITVDWSISTDLAYVMEDLQSCLPAHGVCDPLPVAATLSRNFTAWRRELIDWLYRNRSLRLYYCPIARLYSEINESKAAFAERSAPFRSDRKLQAEIQMEQRQAQQRKSLEERLRKSGQMYEREKKQSKHHIIQTIISILATVFSARIGKKTVSMTTLGKATTAARSASRAVRESGDRKRAKENVLEIQRQLEEQDKTHQMERFALENEFSLAPGNIEDYTCQPLKKDIMVRALVIVWLPQAGHDRNSTAQVLRAT